MVRIRNAFKRIVANDEGATMVEYGLMLALIALVCIAVVALLGTNTSALFTTFANTV